MPPLPENLEDQLIARLGGSVEAPVAADLAAELVRTGGAPTVLELLDELQAASPKIVLMAVEALPDLRRRGALEAVVVWLDLGVTLAGSSGAAAMKYFKESPLLLGLIESEAARTQVLKLALELADTDANVALDFFRTAPELLTILPVAELGSWAEVGLELARWDYVLGIEFFRESPAIARVIPNDLVRSWVGFGMKLVARNSLGKTDYLGTLEFFRTSPGIMGDIEHPTIRKSVVDLGAALADRDPQSAIAFLAEAPLLMRRLPSEAWQGKVLQYGLFVAEQDAEAALSYLRRCPEILSLLGDTTAAQSTFEEWFKGGMDVLSYTAEGARAYFALETKKALASVERAMSGVSLRQIARSLKLFAQGLCGTDVSIRSLPEPADEAKKGPARATVSADGRTIALPAMLRRYPTREENHRLYLIMTAHEAGHLEFGTFDLAPDRLADVIGQVRVRYGRAGAEPIGTLKEVFSLYPQPGLMQDLWTILEDARIESRLQLEYPGLRRDLAVLAREAVTTRSLLHGLSVRELVVDALLLLSTGEPGAVRIPDSIAGIVEQLWTRCQTVLTPHATAEDVIRLADRLYVAMEEMLASDRQEREAAGETQPETDQGAGPKASEETSGQYRPVTNWAYRGAMNPEFVRDREGIEETAAGGQAPSEPSSMTVPQPGGSSPGKAGSGPRRSPDTGEELMGDRPVSGGTPLSAIEQMLAVDDPLLTSRSARAEGRTFLYDEWDGLLKDYRSGWCRVVERLGPDGADDFAGVTRAEHGSVIRLLRRYFESLRPPGLRRIPGQLDGEELDLDAVVSRMADLAAGSEPSERIYVRREKRERDVAAAFLVDLSGSTGRQLDAGDDRLRRVIDVEKEGLVLLSEALEAIGDQYAIYGYSGQGRRLVDFVVLKEFGGPAGELTGRRIGAMTPLQQNRDGAAIRHAVRKLLAREARHRLLILISDGKPLDDGYADEYSLEDTKMALREARMKGIEPFCITVDRTAGDYLRRMYGEVRYLIIDRASALPERLPKIYRQLTKS